jgi:hypothetical protein
VKRRGGSEFHKMYFVFQNMLLYIDTVLLPRLYTGNRDSSGDIAMDYGLDGWGSIPDSGKRFFFSP